jgi:hypothetical protein
MTLINEGENSLKFLIESGMERASLVLAAQAITDQLQGMAEKLAKIESSDVMPMMDSMKANFGADVAQRFEATVTEKLREMSEALRSARDHIGNEIIRMEASVNGQPVSDMAMTGLVDEPSEEEPAAPTDDAGMGDADMGAAPTDAPADDAGAAPGGEEDFSNLFADDDAAQPTGVGRARKESVQTEGARALRESANPDALVFTTFSKEVRAGRATKDAVRIVSEHFEIDSDDVIDIILESRKAK